MITKNLLHEAYFVDHTHSGKYISQYFLEPIYFNLQFCKCYLQNLLGDSGFGIKIGVLDWSLVSNVGNSDARLCDE